MPTDETGSPDTNLVIIRGPSGSGKSSVARQLQLRYGRGCALVEQDYLRRVVLREHDRPGGIAPALIAHTVRFCLDNGYHVVLEGILKASLYADMLHTLVAAHLGRTSVFYLDVTLKETIRRHATRPQATEFTPDDMRGWYIPHDILGLKGEQVIGEDLAMEETIGLIAVAAGLPQDAMSRPIPPAATLDLPGLPGSGREGERGSLRWHGGSGSRSFGITREEHG